MRSGLLFIGMALGFLGCQKTPPAYTQLEGNAQGTTFSVVYADSAGRDFSVAVDSIFRVIDRSMSLWDSTSIISLLNANRPDIRADAHFTKVFNKAWEVSAQTDGYFDCTVGPLVKAWGFSYKKGLSPPDSAQVDSILQLIGYQKVRLEGGKLIEQTPHTEIDFNAIAQGYTVDVLAALLEGQRIRDYLVELGGEIRVRGHRWPSGERLRVGIERPDTSAFAAVALQHVISLAAGGVTTSGNYHKFRRVGALRVSHLINPKTGYPFQNELISVTVVAPDAVTADAYDNALMGMGLRQALVFLRQRPALQAYFIYQRPDGTAAEAATPGFQRLLLQP